MTTKAEKAALRAPSVIVVHVNKQLYCVADFDSTYESKDVSEPIVFSYVTREGGYVEVGDALFEVQNELNSEVSQMTQDEFFDRVQAAVNARFQEFVDGEPTTTTLLADLALDLLQEIGDDFTDQEANVINHVELMMANLRHVLHLMRDLPEVIRGRDDATPTEVRPK